MAAFLPIPDCKDEYEALESRGHKNQLTRLGRPACNIEPIEKILYLRARSEAEYHDSLLGNRNKSALCPPPRRPIKDT